MSLTVERLFPQSIQIPNKSPNACQESEQIYEIFPYVLIKLDISVTINTRLLFDTVLRCNKHLGRDKCYK